jgi:glutamine synthetase
VYALLKAGLDNNSAAAGHENGFLPASIYEAATAFGQSDFIKKILGRENAEKYLGYKLAVADRSPRDLGTVIKASEILYHHEVTNQSLWNRF